MTPSPKFFKRLGRMTVLLDSIELPDDSALFKDSIGLSIKLGYTILRIGSRRRNFIANGRFTIERYVAGDLFRIDGVIHTDHIKWRGMLCLGIDGVCDRLHPSLFSKAKGC